MVKWMRGLCGEKKRGGGGGREGSMMKKKGGGVGSVKGPLIFSTFFLLLEWVLFFREDWSG